MRYGRDHRDHVEMRVRLDGVPQRFLGVVVMQPVAVVVMRFVMVVMRFAGPVSGHVPLLGGIDIREHARCPACGLPRKHGKGQEDCKPAAHEEILGAEKRSRRATQSALRRSDG
jgi:hypothetical protein